jgi:hypothetical protein
MSFNVYKGGQSDSTEEVVTKKKKVAILGTVPHKLQAPFDNDEFETIPIVNMSKKCVGVKLSFELLTS